MTFGITDLDIQSILLNERLVHPELPRELLQKRKRRDNWQHSPLMILAVDHPGRRVTSAGGDLWAMAVRPQLLRRTMQILMQPGVDGLLATPDIMEEVLLLNHWMVQNGGPDGLHRKVLIGSMNRGGLANTVFELDDFITGYTADAIRQMNLDAGKFLLRVNPESVDSSKTLAYCVAELERLSEHKLPVFLEPLAVPHTTDELVRLVGVASALGSTSMGRWLKLPMTDDFHRVSRATSCPIVLLGGDNVGSTEELVNTVKRCFDGAPNVKGLMLGRSVMYPRDGRDPATIATELAAFIHSQPIEEVRTWGNL